MMRAGGTGPRIVIDAAYAFFRPLTFLEQRIVFGFGEADHDRSARRAPAAPVPAPLPNAEDRAKACRYRGEQPDQHGADAGHTVRAHARFIHDELHAHFVMIAKENTPKVFARLNAMPWETTPIAHTTIETGHGRWEKRTIRVLDAPDDLDFPHVKQVFLIERTTIRTVCRRTKNSKKIKKTKVTHCAAALGMTSLTAEQASPEHLATYVRSH